MNLIRILAHFCLAALSIAAAENKPPVRFAIVGLAHDHARGFIPGALARKDIELAGIVEEDLALREKYARQYKLEPGLFFSSIDELLAKTKVQAVAAFTSTFDHKRVVEQCAPRGLHIMMEKPLAVNMDHARAMAAAAQKAGVHLLVNFETTWYPANHAAYRIVNEQKAIGEIRKMIVNDGHRGPKEIGCSPEFLEWLTDPVQNGGGALTDFGCYGANLMTWLMRGERPLSVFAVTQKIKPDVYPKVDDEATIVLTYPKAQGIIQASWNWPYNRKDMEVYGRTGYVIAPRSNHLRVLRPGDPEEEETPDRLPEVQADPLSYLAAVVRGEIQPSGLSSLEINMIAVEILDAARQSAASGKRIDLPR